jgi:drug/metabolite transporter (DMT)-like permease
MYLMNRLRADLVLLLVAIIWGSAFAVQRVATQYFDPYTFNGLRFLLGGMILLPFSRFNPWRRGQRVSERVSATEKKYITSVLDRKSIFFILSAGLVLFAGSTLQQAGLKYTTAGNAGFITTLYVVMVPIILVTFFREKIHWIAWLSAGIAIAGSLLLSTGGTLRLTPGDSLEMAGSIMWALDVILVSRAVKHVEVLTFSVGHFLTAAVFCILISVWMPGRLAGVSEGWWTIIYIGVLSTAVGYTLQALGQKYSPPNDATILLSMEAVFAALAGFIFLGGTMLPVQLVGCGMILVAVIITQLNAIKSRMLAVNQVDPK